ncbi:PEP_CTERM-anchored TLD domain-containing protein [Aestuariispira insulae]|uniref:Putative secreted protein with PEP-CTERM sorting signal n=1 Tax=Aestuariispira insulae TaxID=1461337 RepID=A0A3D9HQD4_9PROT|nr:PEP_CTERM-anchored TLD domain-containing protein [Aestuariispira insulae]RED51521.1 putative secreted protein with PEP-CTERM sorting signal [Aestuariispira insulae]
MKKLTYLLFSLMMTSAGLTGKATAGVIIGDSDLLNDSHLTQLENWLGEGPLALTSIYQQQDSDRATDWHDAVDNRVRSFTLIEINLGAQTMLVGGYNPYSWDASLRTYRLTRDEADRTAFIYNLSLGMKLDQDLTTSYGRFQTFNSLQLGPAFGVGMDLRVTSDLNYLSSNLGYSYGDVSRRGDNDYAESFVGGHRRIAVSKIETFTIAHHTHTDVTAPGSLALMGLGLMGLAMRRREKR